ncbi:biotin/lipoyl-containing protein [Alicyclobacillus fastidiosus]|uniref:Biotin attachment protein n=1 Tax=Alicyclobacillus fastidiosus TaxID=392011 RepID=A0ABV5AAW8_9BACL|nr:biotin/lipoyl-containing protein [Alicyclobacillus fastidiosus]WEH11825.1 biotin attachment protein [Alicyclobacillus fastidiosus]
MVDVKLPQLGDSVDKALVTTWLKQVGDHVEQDEPLLEVTTDKVTIEVPSEYAGTVKEILVPVGQQADMNAVLCRIEEA